MSTRLESELKMFKHNFLKRETGIYIEIEPFFLSKCDFWREDACLNIFCSLTPWKTGRYHLTEDKIELSDFSLHISIIQVTT